jgi:hypothetical protein
VVRVDRMTRYFVNLWFPGVLSFQKKLKKIKKCGIIKMVWKYILGPNSSTRHVLHNKQIYIFGEYHTQRHPFKGIDQNNAIEISKFLRWTANQNPNKILDLFVEAGPTSKPRKTNDQGILFGDFRAEWNECPSNVRIHKTDIRQNCKNLWNLFQNIWSLADCVFEQTVEKHTMLNKIKETQSIVNRLERQFGEIDLEWPLLLTGATQYFKTLPDLNQDKIRAAFIERDMKRNLVTFSEISDFLQLQSKDLAISIWTRLNDFLSAVMDIYTMSMILSPQFQNVIIYTGQFHADKYRYFLNNNKFKMTNESSSQDQILDISQFAQAFF